MLVQRLAAGLVDRLVADVQDLLAEEAHDFFVALEIEAHEPKSFGPVQELEHAILVDLGAACQHAHRDALAERRSLFEQAPGLRVEGGDLLPDDVRQRLGQIALLERLDHPLPPDECHLPVGHQLPNDLAEEERVPLSDASQVLSERVAQPQVGEHTPQVVGDVFLVQGAELQPTDAELTGLGRAEALDWRGFPLGRPRHDLQRRAADEHRKLLALEQGPEQEQGRFVGELQVVDDQDEWPAVDHEGNETRQRREGAFPPRTLVAVGRGRRGVGDLGHDPGEVGHLLGAEALHDGRALIFPLVQQGAQDARREVVRAKGFLLVAPHPRHGEALRAGDVALDRGQQGGLPHPRRPVEDEELASPPPEGHERLRDRAQLGVPPHDPGRKQPVERGPGKDLLRVHVRRGRRLVSSRLLGVIQGRVGRLHELAARGRVCRRRGSADAQRDADRPPDLA